MATLDDILTTQKNGVVAINNLSQSLASFYDEYQFIAGTTTTITVGVPTTLVVGAGRLVSYTTVVTGGASTGLIFDAVSYATTAATGNGVTATLTYNGLNAFQVGDNVYVYGVTPSGYNSASIAGDTVTGISSNTVSYANATSAAQTVAGLVMNVKDSQKLIATSGTLGTYQVGSFFTRGLTIVPASGQLVNVTYSLS